MRFVLMSCKRKVSHNSGNVYFKAIVFDFDCDVCCDIFIDEKLFSFLNESNYVGKSVDEIIVFKYDVERKAYKLSFDINKLN